MVSYAVVGASRGIGLEYVRQLATRSDATVIAIVRNAHSATHLSAAISGLKNVYVVEADVADHGSLEAAAKKAAAITGGTLDCLIHNAARMDGKKIMLGFDDFSSMEALDEDFLDAYKTNALGVIHSIVAFLPLLRSSTASIKKIIVLSTGAASPSFVKTYRLANMVAYGMTKAAALMATTKWALKLKDEGFVVVSLSPGLVDTSGTATAAGAPVDSDVFTGFSMTNNVLLQTPQQSVSLQLQVIDGLKPEDNGSFMNNRGGQYD